MNIQERRLNDVAVLDLDGSFTLGGQRLFKQHVDANIEAGGRKLIINLAKVNYMDSSGLGELISCFIAMQRVNGHIKLIHLNDRLSNLLITTKLITVFETFDSEPAAVSSFVLRSEEAEMKTGSWLKYHLNESIEARALEGEGRYRATIIEPEAQNRISIDSLCDTLEIAMSRADELVQEAYPHDCKESGCSPWTQFE